MKIRTLGIIGAAGLLAVASVAPVSAQAPTDPLRVVEIPAGEPLVIGAWGVNTGPNASLGQDWQNSVQIAVDDRDGMFMGHEIQIVTEDGLCTPEGGAAAALKLASNSQVVGLIGSACSDETVGGIKTITDAGLTTISPSNTRPALTAPDRSADFAGYLRTAHSDAFQGKAVAEFVYNELGKTKAATIHDGSSYGEALQQVFADEFVKLGGTITVQEAVQAGVTTDMKPVLTAVAATEPEVIYYPIFTAEGGAITAQSREVAGLEDVVLIGSDGMFSADFVKAAGPAALGMYLSSPNFSAFQAGYADLLTKYVAMTGANPPQAFHAHGYDATNILFAALEKVAVQDGDTLYVPLGALRDAIYATKDFQGVTGVLSCSPSGDCGAPLIAVYQITQDVIDGAWPPAAPIWPVADPMASPAASTAP